MVKDYDETAKNDPLTLKDPNAPAFQQLQQRKKEFLAKESNSTEVTSMCKGVMPPGVKTQTWFDDDKYFAYGMAIYLPSATARASGAAKSMQQGQIIQQPGGGSGVTPGTNQPDAGTLQQGPSGQVQKNDAL